MLQMPLSWFLQKDESPRTQDHTFVKYPQTPIRADPHTQSPIIENHANFKPWENPFSLQVEITKPAYDDESSQRAERGR